nr:MULTISPECIES: DUF4129 domain-containing protein [Thermoanaerobacter]
MVNYLAKKGLKKSDTETPLEYQTKVLANGYIGFDKVTQIYNETVYGGRTPTRRGRLSKRIYKRVKEKEAVKSKKNIRLINKFDIG